MAVEKKLAAAEAEVKAEAPAKKAAAPKTEKKPAAKKEEVKAAAPAAKKAPAKKVEPKTSVVVEFAGKQFDTKDVVAAATKAYKKANKGAVIKKIEVYVKPEENVAYYVVNGEGSDDYKVEL